MGTRVYGFGTAFSELSMGRGFLRLQHKVLRSGSGVRMDVLTVAREQRDSERSTCQSP